MAVKKSTIEHSADREILVSRVVDAPRELVWEAWTNPEHVARWWGPIGFSTTIKKMDVRPGGVWEHTMRGPDGAEYPNKSVFVEVVKPERIVYKHGGRRAGGPGVSFEATWTFEELAGGKTRITGRSVFATAGERERVIKEFNALEGAKQHLGQLADYLPDMPGEREIVNTRVVRAPRELVWEALTKKEHVELWWGPRGFRNTFRTFEVKNGGEWLFTMHGPDGTDYPNHIRFDEVVKPEKLVLTHGVAADDPNAFHSVITLEDRGGETKITLRAILASKAARDKVAKYAVEGGRQTLERLEEHVAVMAVKPFVISRAFDAPRELVWKAWTEEARLKEWFGPKGFKMSHAKLDLRRGGIFHYALRGPDGKEMWGKWMFREIVPPEKLVLVSSFSDEKGGVTTHPMAPTWPRETISKTTFVEKGGKTEVTIEWAPLNATDEEIKTFEAGRAGMTQGWGGTFEQLAEYLAKR